jgi:hypothetical protein
MDKTRVWIVAHEQELKNDRMLNPEPAPNRKPIRTSLVNLDCATWGMPGLGKEF